MLGTRLFILGALVSGGPMHGHKIRNTAQVDRVELWADIKPGSLYGALRRMATEGVVEAVRTEQDGNLPARTVYAITEKGRAEFLEQVRAAFADSRLRPGPIQVALQHADQLDPAELRELVADRRQKFVAQLEFWRKTRVEAEPYLKGLEPVAFDYTLMRLETEVAWHDQLLAQLPGPKRDP